MLGRDVVIDARNTALHERSEALNRVRVDIPAHVDLCRMMNAPVTEPHVSQRIIEPSFIGKDRGRGHAATHDMRQNVRRLRRRRDDFRDNPTAAFNHPENGSFAFPSRGASQALRETLVAVFAAEIRFVKLDFARQLAAIIGQRITKTIENAPRGFIGDAKLAPKLFSGDTASRACDQVHRVEPEMKGRGRLVEDRPRGRVQMMPTRDTRPRLPLLRCRVALERANFVALWAMRVLAISGQTIVPKPVQARVIVGELLHELHQRIARVGRDATYRILSISCGHENNLASLTYTVKGYLPT
jgi:hypothetical protein